MTFLENVLARLLRDLSDAGARYALVGGLAVSVRTEPRFTRDLDLAMAVDDDLEAESIIRGLVGRGHTVSAVMEHEERNRLATVRLLPAGGSLHGVVADLLFASSGIENELVSEAQALEVFSGIVVPVARVGHLIALKLLSRDDVNRPQDVGDLAALLKAGGAEELDVARHAIGLIEARGFTRGRDLRIALDRWIVGEDKGRKCRFLS